MYRRIFVVFISSHDCFERGCLKSQLTCKSSVVRTCSMNIFCAVNIKLIDFMCFIFTLSSHSNTFITILWQNWMSFDTTLVHDVMNFLYLSSNTYHRWIKIGSLSAACFSYSVIYSDIYNMNWLFLYIGSSLWFVSGTFFCELSINISNFLLIIAFYLQLFFYSNTKFR